MMAHAPGKRSFVTSGLAALLVASCSMLSPLGCSSEEDGASGGAGSAGAAGGAGAGASAGAAGIGAGGSAGAAGSAAGGSAGSAGAAGSAAGGSAGSAGAAGSGGQGGAPFLDKPYGHVVPADVGVWIGLGVVAPAPTDTYTGSTTITEPSTIENVVIDGCLRIESNDVILRNVHIKCNGLYPVRASAGFSNLLVEYSKIECSSDSKVFLVDNFTKLTVTMSETIGCEDLFFIGGAVSGMKVRYNYFHDLNLTSQSHSDGFQIGEASATTGDMLIQGNYFHPNSDGGKNDIVFATNQAQAALTIQDNFFRIWGLRTLRCNATTSCDVRTNVYEQAFEELQPAGFNGKLLFLQAAGAATFECNRFEDGTFLQEVVNNVDRVAGAEHVTDNCPSFE